MGDAGTTSGPDRPSETFRIERLKVFGNIATVAITVIIGTVGVALINRDFQNRQLEQADRQNTMALALQEKKAEAERRQAEMQYLGEYVQYALENDIAKRIRFAEYFAKLTISTDLKGRWEDYRDELIKLRDDEEKLKIQIVEAVERGDVQESARLQSDLSKIRPAIEQLTPQTPAEYASIFPRIRTDELELSNRGEEAFLSGDYEWAIRFLEQARRVEGSGVWQSDYPYLIGAYLLMNDEQKADKAIKDMLTSMKRGRGYLSSQTTRSFVLRALGHVRGSVPDQYVLMIDNVIDQVLSIKSGR